eukprot:TRINITY_DN1217_c0_g1_i9.p2 TRINITY_DN1217_c0_g1~~TRINITY_DN1217_c0_g1_i9.p2  ORF type:complete len:130 (+),score=21.52 TRINITY_DN1217_c0_g1_i9:122-511(+)
MDPRRNARGGDRANRREKEPRQAARLHTTPGPTQPDYLVGQYESPPPRSPHPPLEKKNNKIKKSLAETAVLTAAATATAAPAALNAAADPAALIAATETAAAAPAAATTAATTTPAADPAIVWRVATSI